MNLPLSFTKIVRFSSAPNESDDSDDIVQQARKFGRRQLLPKLQIQKVKKGFAFFGSGLGSVKLSRHVLQLRRNLPFRFRAVDICGSLSFPSSILDVTVDDVDATLLSLRPRGLQRTSAKKWTRHEQKWTETTVTVSSCWRDAAALPSTRSAMRRSSDVCLPVCLASSLSCVILREYPLMCVCARALGYALRHTQMHGTLVAKRRDSNLSRQTNWWLIHFCNHRLGLKSGLEQTKKMTSQKDTPPFTNS